MTQTVPAVLLIDQPTVSMVADIGAVIIAVEAAFAAHASGLSLGPKLAHVDADGGEFHIKAGGLVLDGRTYFACKVGGGFFNNRTLHGLPSVIGLIMLCDGTTGVPLAVMDSSTITALRTGAATAVAAKYLARADSQVVLVCGAGVQAAVQLRFLKQVLPLKCALIWARKDCSAFASQMASELQMEVRLATDLEVAGPQSDVIVTCTPAKKGFLHPEHVARGTFIAAVGADSPGKQELDPRLVSECSVVCDITEQCLHVGELQYCASPEGKHRPHLRGEIGAVITGRVPGRKTSDEIILFDSTGTALQDVAAAAMIYKTCISRRVGQTFPFRP